MKKNLISLGSCLTGFLMLSGFVEIIPAQTIPAAHWINESGADAATVLNTNGVFITDFKTNNDLTVTRLAPDSVSLFTESFGGTTPGNNPSYLTQFTGVSTNGTGDGVMGHIRTLDMTAAATGTLQFDFLPPLTPGDRIVFADIDSTEQYLLQAYVLNGSSYDPADLSGWKLHNFSGATGRQPDSDWPSWDPETGLLTASGASFTEGLSVLTPDQNIDRLVITKNSVAGWSTTVTFVSPLPMLTIRQSGSDVILSWDNAGFNLQSAPDVVGTYTNVPNAVSPYTNAISGQQQFFRLIN